MRQWIEVELRDAFGTPVARGRLAVLPDVTRIGQVTGISDDGPVILAGPELGIWRAPFWPALTSAEYVQDEPVNPALPAAMRITGAGRGRRRVVSVQAPDDQIGD